MPRLLDGALSAQGLRFAIILSRFNGLVGERLLEGALDALQRSGAHDEDVLLVRVPGAYEIPAVARVAAESGEHDAVICLGAVIRGATAHFDYVAGEAARGIARVAFETAVPVAFGVLTTESLEQAMERAGGKGGNKGFEAATTAIELAHVYRQMGRVRGRAGNRESSNPSLMRPAAPRPFSRELGEK